MSTKKAPKPKYVSHTFFNQAMSGFNEKLDLALTRLDRMSTNSAYALLKGEQRLDRVEKTMVMKDDLKNFATKDDLKETNGRFDKLAVEFLKLGNRFERLENSVGQKIDSVMVKLMDRFDFVMGNVKEYDRQSTFNGHRLSELEPVVKDHESRIAALESRPPDKTTD